MQIRHFECIQDYNLWSYNILTYTNNNISLKKGYKLKFIYYIDSYNWKVIEIKDEESDNLIKYYRWRFLGNEPPIDDDIFNKNIFQEVEYLYHIDVELPSFYGRDGRFFHNGFPSLNSAEEYFEKLSIHKETRTEIITGYGKAWLIDSKTKEIIKTK